MELEAALRVMAFWTFDPTSTVEPLLAASKGVTSGKPTLFVDGSSESFNGAVDELIKSGLLGTCGDT